VTAAATEGPASGETRDMFDPPSSGGWVLLFALSAAAPAVGWILWPKRGA
jgi:hypothetical protein